MKRKVARIGPSTLMVSLPSAWVKKYNIKKSQEVNLEVEGNRLLISTERVDESKSTTLNVSKLDKMMLRYLVSLYKKGYDEVHVTFDKPELISQIQAAIGKEAVGYEIMEQGKRSLVIKNISETLTDYNGTFRRTVRLLVSMAEECETALRAKDYSILNNVAFLEEANNRFTTTLRRALNKKGLEKHEETNLFYYIVEEIEKIADQYKYLCRYFYDKRNKKIELGKTLDLLTEVNKCLRVFSEVYFKYDEKKVVWVGNERKRMVALAIKWIEEGNPEQRILAHYCLMIMQEVFCLIGPYLAMTL